jgi:CRP-like cAMP-binding protein
MVTRALELTSGMPEVHLEVGDELFARETTHRSVAVLVSGRLLVAAGGSEIARLDVPGAFVGEIGALLDVERSARVTALEPSSVRMIGDPIAFFQEHPELALELARQLAGRLHRLVAYLADVRAQYADREDHLGMVDALLGKLAARPPLTIDPGSDRSPDY